MLGATRRAFALPLSSRHSARIVFGLLVLNAVVVRPGLVFAQAAEGPEKAKVYKEEYRPSFKDDPKAVPGLKIFATEPERVIYKDDALRITLPPDTVSPRTGDGVATEFGVQGDFDISLRFEILKGAGKSASYPTDLKLVIVPDEPAAPGVWHRGNQNRASLSRQLPYADGADAFVANIARWTPPTNSDPVPADKTLDRFGRPNFSHIERQTTHAFPAKAMSGGLRLVRSGAELSFFCGDGADANLTFFNKSAFVAKDVKDVRILASTGGPGAEIDVRITDVVIRADAFPKSRLLPYAIQKTGPGRLAELLSKGAIFAWVAGPLGALAILLGVWRAVKSRSSGQKAVSGLEFFCALCGARLKVKAELAGKSVKCPHCAAPTHVPGGAPKEEQRP
jgi:hypothetical protein